LIPSDLKADRTRCKRCGELLAKHCRYRRVDICNKQIVELTCLSCGYVNRILWQAWLPATANMVAAKQKCQHGEWLEWLGENCPEISQQTTSNYMRTYQKMIDYPNYQLIGNLTPSQAYRELGIVKDPADKLEVETPPLPEGKFNVIYADPPWDIGSMVLEKWESPYYIIVSYLTGAIRSLFWNDLPKYTNYGHNNRELKCPVCRRPV